MSVAEFGNRYDIFLKAVPDRNLHDPFGRRTPKDDEVCRIVFAFENYLGMKGENISVYAEKLRAFTT